MNELNEEEEEEEEEKQASGQTDESPEIQNDNRCSRNSLTSAEL